MKLHNIFALGFCGTLLSCGDSTFDLLTRPTAASGTLSSTVASELAGESDITEGITGAVSADTDQATDILDESDTFSTASLSTQSAGLKPQADACAPTGSGTDTDADGDGIKVSYTQSFDCSDTVEGLKVSAKGTIAQTDKNDSDDYGGFTISVSDMEIKLSGGGSSFTFQAEASAESTKNSLTSYTGKYDFATKMEASADGSSANVLFGFYLDSTVSPASDSNSDPTDSGTATITGFMKVSGTVDSSSVDVVLAVSASLTYNSTTCTTGDNIVSGPITLTDGGGNTFVTTYASCNATYKYNGATITATSSGLLAKAAKLKASALRMN